MESTWWNKISALLLACIFIVMLIILISIFISKPDEMDESDWIAKDRTTQDSITSLDGDRLVVALHELGVKVDDLKEVLNGLSMKDGLSSMEDKVLKTKIEPSPARLEELVEKLIQTLNSSALSSERNTLLRENLEGFTNREPIQLSDLWSSKEAAKNSLLMLTYSQVLKRTGPPKKISGQPLVQWFYPDGQISFVDGYVNFVQSKRWK